MPLVLHTAAYWLILAVRDAIPKTHALWLSSRLPNMLLMLVFDM